MVSKKAAKKATAKKTSSRENSLTMGLPTTKKTPPAKVERKRVNHTGRDPAIKRTYEPG